MGKRFTHCFTQDFAVFLFHFLWPCFSPPPFLTFALSLHFWMFQAIRNTSETAKKLYKKTVFFVFGFSGCFSMLAKEFTQLVTELFLSFFFFLFILAAMFFETRISTFGSFFFFFFHFSMFYAILNTSRIPVQEKCIFHCSFFPFLDVLCHLENFSEMGPKTIFAQFFFVNHVFFLKCRTCCSRARLRC